MQKKINRGMLFVVLTGVVLVTLLLSVVFYFLLAGEVKTALWENAYNLKYTLNAAADKPGMLSEVVNRHSQVRYTLIDAGGNILYDSDYDASLMENHGDRQEFIAAKSTGQGESKRRSDTMGQESYYVAYLLEDGSVIRLSQTSRSILGVFFTAALGMLGVVVLAMLLSAVLSKQLTLGIVGPLNRIDMDAEDVAIYDELAIFQKTINCYKEEVRAKIAQTQNNANLIGDIIGNINEGILLLDPNGMVITANKSALAILQGTKDAFGKNILELTREMPFLENTRLALGGQKRELLLENENQRYQVFFCPAEANGVIVLFLDISDKTAAEELRKEFTANVSHELKTPLTSISGYAEMVASGIAKPDDVAMFAQKIQDEASRLILLVDDILLLSRLDEDHYDVESTDVNLGEMAECVMDALAEKAKAAGVSVSAQGGATMKANGNLMYELLYNLVDNGIKYNRPGGRVHVTLTSERGHTTIEVEDTGIGIPKENLWRIFERFYRVEQSRAKKTGGTGLGLSIVKHIARLYGGRVSAQSSVGKGTTIKVQFGDGNP